MRNMSLSIYRGENVFIKQHSDVFCHVQYLHKIHRFLGTLLAQQYYCVYGALSEELSNFLPLPCHLSVVRST
jgi:hypothetical protein